MSNEIFEIAEKYLEEIRKLDAEFKAYEKLRDGAICMRNRCLANRDNEGYAAWDKVREHCVGKCMIIRQDIRDRYYECMRLSAKLGA